MPIIDIKDFKGVWTHGDLEDIPLEYLTELKNTRPWNGQLIKTYGFAIHPVVDKATANQADGIFVYVDDDLTGDGMSGEMYVAVYVAANNTVTFYAWDVTADQWDALTDIANVTVAATYYHKNARNPIFQNSGILRILPGNLGIEPGASNECKGLWLGYIDRDYFDENYLPATYTAGYFGYETNIVFPALTLSATEKDVGETTGHTTGNVRFYKLSYIYDGIQESLLSDLPQVVTISTTNRLLELSTTITAANHNKRVTGINVYRSDITDGDYKLLSAVDLLRDSDDVKSNATGGYSGVAAIYIPGLDTFDFDGVSTYEIRSGGDDYHILDTDFAIPSGFDNIIFRVTAGGSKTSFSTDEYDFPWELWIDGGAKQDEDTADGMYAGIKTIIISESQTTNEFIGGLIQLDTTHYRLVDRNKLQAVHFGATTSVAATVNQEWVLMSPSKGLYYTSFAGGVATYYIYDIDQTPSGGHPLEGETSIKINAEHSKVIGDILWQGNLVLDPGGKNEKQPSWISYSELNQLDVNPVSNVYTLPDREGGGITGVEEMMGNPVFLKKQLVASIDTRNDPITPSKWRVNESVHNIGNIAPVGHISVLDSLFICYYDGIYRLRPNNLAESDKTPTISLKISDPIGDTYNGLTTAQKILIEAQYDQTKNEVLFLLPVSGLRTEIWAFNLLSDTWREINTAVSVDLMALDEEANVLAYQTSDDKIYVSSDVNNANLNKESTTFEAQTKTFDISSERDEPIRYISVTYKSVDALTMYIHINNLTTIVTGSIESGVTYLVIGDTSITYDGTVTAAGSTFIGKPGITAYTKTGGTEIVLPDDQAITLPAQTTRDTYRIAVRLKARKLQINIQTTSGSTDETEIDRIMVE